MSGQIYLFKVKDHIFFYIMMYVTYLPILHDTFKFWFFYNFLWPIILLFMTLVTLTRYSEWTKKSKYCVFTIKLLVIFCSTIINCFHFDK